MTQSNKRQAASRGACCDDIGAFLEARFFRALCDPSRLGILADLVEAGEPRTVGGIARDLPVDVSVVSRHLALLREAGIVAAEKRGREVYYTVRYQDLATTLRAIADAIHDCCPPGMREEEPSHERASGST